MTTAKIELQSELDNPGIVARRDDAAEVATAVQVADGIGEIWMIKQVEELGAKLEVL